MNSFEIKISDNGNWEYRAQKVWSDNEDEKIHFRVNNLSEYPEDAIIGRDLFSAHDFIEAVKLGFRIAKRGYDEIVVTEVPWGD